MGDLVREYQLNKFFTLTVRQDKCTLEEAWLQVSDTWNKFLTVMRRKYDGLLYVAVLEEHVSGYPHVHGFTNIWIPQEEWSKRWSACGGGSVVWVERVKNDISEYVSKQWNIAHYVGKQAICGPKRRLVRRTIWRSVGMKTVAEVTKRSEDLWRLLKGHIFDDGRLRDHGETEQCRKDLEGARWAPAKESPDPGGQDLETEGSASQHVQDQQVAVSACQSER